MSEAVEEFLRNGGKIQKIPTGVGTELKQTAIYRGEKLTQKQRNEIYKRAHTTPIRS